MAPASGSRISSASQPITHFTEGEIRSHEWSPDGRRIVLIRASGDVSNLWSVAADGRDAVAITDFETGSIFSILPTHDGKDVVFTYGNESQNLVLVRNFQN